MDKFFMIFRPNRYTSLKQGTDASDSSEKLLGPENPRDQCQTRYVASGVTITWWRATCLLIAWVLTTSMASLWLNTFFNPPYLKGIELKSLEFKDAERWIERDIVKFTGTPIFEEGGVAYREYAPGIKQYVGNTSDVKDAWDELLRQRYFLVDEDEIKAIFPNNYHDYYHTDLGWWIGLDGFHILHCVNIVRRALDSLRSGNVNNTSFQVYHEDHCIDLIRQSVQCNIDLTPVPERRWPGQPHFIDSNQPHVCRNVWTLRRFLDMRHNKTRQLIEKYEAETDRPYVEGESAMGVFGFPERKGHEQDYRPPYLRDLVDTV